MVFTFYRRITAPTADVYEFEIEIADYDVYFVGGVIAMQSFAKSTGVGNTGGYLRELLLTTDSVGAMDWRTIDPRIIVGAQRVATLPTPSSANLQLMGSMSCYEISALRAGVPIKDRIFFSIRSGSASATSAYDFIGDLYFSVDAI